MLLLLSMLLFSVTLLGNAACIGVQNEGRPVDSERKMTFSNVIKKANGKAVRQESPFIKENLPGDKKQANTTQQEPSMALESKRIGNNDNGLMVEGTGEIKCGVVGSGSEKKGVYCPLIYSELLSMLIIARMLFINNCGDIIKSNIVIEASFNAKYHLYV